MEAGPDSETGKSRFLDVVPSANLRSTFIPPLNAYLITEQKLSPMKFESLKSSTSLRRFPSHRRRGS
jgi:hypothetical protein